MRNLDIYKKIQPLFIIESDRLSTEEKATTSFNLLLKIPSSELNLYKEMLSRQIEIIDLLILKRMIKNQNHE